MARLRELRSRARLRRPLLRHPRRRTHEPLTGSLANQARPPKTTSPRRPPQSQQLLRLRQTHTRRHRTLLPRPAHLRLHPRGRTKETTPNLLRWFNHLGQRPVFLEVKSPHLNIN